MRERSDQSRAVCELHCSFGEQSGQSRHNHEEAGVGNEDLRGALERRQETLTYTDADPCADGYANSYSDGDANSYSDGDSDTHAYGDPDPNTYIIRSLCKRRERTSASLNSSMRISFSRDL